MTVYPSDLDKAILYYNTQLRQFEECKKIKAVTPEDYEWAEKHRQLAEWLEELRELRKQKGLPSVTPKRKTGKRLDAVLPNDNGGLPVEVCDQCNTFFPLAFIGGALKFRPNCGADMRGENE